MKTRKTRGAFVIGLALLGATTFLTLPSCGGSQQSQKAVTAVSLRVEGAKTEYLVGEKFDKTNLKVYVVMSDGSEKEVDDYYVSPSKALKIDDKIVTIYYEDLSIEVEITVRYAAVTGLELDVSNVELEVNGRHQIVATITPDEAAEAGCTFASNKEDVATVDENGLITAKGVGSAVISVSTVAPAADGNPLTKTVNVTVKETATTGLEIDVDDITLLKGEEKQIGVTVLPSNATNKKVTFASSAPTVASVSDSGLVKALNEGEATITVTTDAKGTDGQPFVQSFVVTVIDSSVKFAVAFRNTDGTLIQGYKADQITAGEVPAFTAKAPRKATDAQGVYIFRGFDKEILPYEASTEEITYTAVYQKRQYTVTDVSLQLEGEKLVYEVVGTAVGNTQFELRNMIKGGSWSTETLKLIEPMSYKADGSWVLRADLLDSENSFIKNNAGTPYIGKFRVAGSSSDEDLKALIRNDALRYRHTLDGEVIEINTLPDNWDGIDGYEDLSDEFKAAIPAPTWDGLNISFEETVVSAGGYEYKLYANADTWNCVSLVAQKEGSIDATVTPTSADVELINNKPYYVVNGTFTGSYSLDQYHKAYGINLQHHGNLGWSDWNYVLGDKTVKFDFDKTVSTFNTTTHEFTAKFLMDTSLFPVSVDGIFLVHSVLNGGEVDNLKVTAGTNLIQADGHQYEILKNDDTWTICCLKVTSLA